MPIARVVARRFEDALQFAENLRSRFSTIEIAAPDHQSTSVAALEIRLDECSPREALGRVLEYLADHPFAAEPVVSKAEEKAAEELQPGLIAELRPGLMRAALEEPAPVPAVNLDLPAVENVQPAAMPALAANAQITPGAPVADAAPSWFNSVRTFWRVRFAPASTSLTAAKAARGSEKLRQQREAQFWIPSAYKEPAWSEAERQCREELERGRLAEIAAQRQRVAEARRKLDRQIAMQLAAERERLAHEERQRREEEREERRRLAAVSALTAQPVEREVRQEKSDATAAGVSAAFRVNRRSGTLTPLLRQREISLWKQATGLATAAAILIALAITTYANRRTPAAAPIEVEREPAQVSPVKPAAEEGSAKQAPVLLTSAENEPNRGERGNAPAPTWHRHAAPDEVDYIARDVTIRYFDRSTLLRADNGDVPRSRSTNVVVRRATGIKQISDLDHN